MPLNDKEISALTNLIGEVVRFELEPVLEEMREFRSEAHSSFDALFKRDETRQEEYLAVRTQPNSLERKFTTS